MSLSRCIVTEALGIRLLLLPVVGPELWQSAWRVLCAEECFDDARKCLPELRAKVKFDPNVALEHSMS